MMFNGLLMYGDSDTSDFGKDSIGAVSIDSAASEGTRVQLLENKLHATMQILKNKEETIRVQAESLALAEARITAKAQSLPKMHQTQQTHNFSTRSSAVGNHFEMTDVSTSYGQDVDPGIVKSLRDNLSVIEELYRECFYETAKQEELINILRRSYLDMRLEKKQTEQSHMIWQRNSMEKCQDIALEVEHLKSEITNFLNNSSNNDSGMWEREEGAADELRLIADQLRRLRVILDSDCTCGLEEENKKLKQLNESMKSQVSDLQYRLAELEKTVEGKEDADQRYQLQILEKEQELQRIREQMFSIEESSRERDDSCDALTVQVQQLEALLSDKTAELYSVQRQCESQDVIIKELHDNIHKAESMAKEKSGMEAQVSQLKEEVVVWRDRCRRIAARYRDKSNQVNSLQSDVYESRTRGAALCAHAQRAACAVRRWVRAQRDAHVHQEEIIKQQEMLIRALRTRNSNTESVSDEPCCSRHLRRARRNDASRTRASETASTSHFNDGKRQYTTRANEIASTSYLNDARRQYPTRASETASISYLDEARRQYSARASEIEHSRSYIPESFSRHLDFIDRSGASETTCGRCSRASETESPAPTPPVRLLRKKSVAGEKREVTSPSELLERVERAHEALCDARRRWNCT